MIYDSFHGIKLREVKVAYKILQDYYPNIEIGDNLMGWVFNPFYNRKESDLFDIFILNGIWCGRTHESSDYKNNWSNCNSKLHI